ncbi:DUF3857 domain-containing protein [Flavobacterium sp. N1736]|uniref:DUF3857 domain-containing protein n=1 Tax=Flavobacterium sp. N1736 TaxID=2986823 RepID=UPI002225532E|nr:DUF3857 domain-containing protein [Flavobacterium sp. N1736]
MRFESVVLVIFLLFGISKIKAQNYELNKVTIEELQEKVNAKDTSAPAAILFKKGKTYFTYNSGIGFTAQHVYEFKIKIYKTEGLSWANHIVSYYVGYENLKDDTVNFSNAVTYNLENGAIVKTKLNSEGSFKNKINKYWNQATITLPNVKVGSIIEFKYILKSENLVRLPDFDFQYDIPVNFFEYKTEIPEFFIYKTLLIGDHKIESKLDVVASGQLYASGYKQINSLYTAQNIPALKNEKFVDNIDNYKGAIQNELERKRFPDEPVVDLTKTWEGVTKTIYKNENFGDQLKLNDYFSVDLKALLQDISNPKERLNAIFKFVQNKMNWNKERGYYVDKGVKKAYEARTGNVAEINFILISMLKSAGIEVSPILVSTIENGTPVFPNRTVFNCVIAAAEIDGKKILLDATNKFTTPNVLPLNLLNWKGRLIKEDGDSEEIELIPAIASKDNYTLMATINPNLRKIDGSLRIRRADYSAFSFREENADKSEDSYLEKLENDLSKIEINDYTIENKSDDLSQPVVEKFNFMLNNPYDVIDGKIFLKPLLFFADNRNPFVQEQRQMPIYFGYPHQYTYNIFLEVPDGYEVESLPKPLRIMTENKDAAYMMNMAAEENKIQIQVTKEINRAIFAASDYDMLKEFFQKIIVSQNEKIVLKKI